MTQQIIAYGAKVERARAAMPAPEDWAEIPECKGVSVPSVTTEYVDVTNLNSPGGYREYIKGLKDAGEISMPCGYTADGYEQQLGDEAFNGVIQYRVTLRPAPGQSAGDVFTFSGYPTPQLEANDVGAPVAMTVAIRTSGAFTWARGAAIAGGGA